MTTPFNPKREEGNKKLIYAARNVWVVKANSIRQHESHTDDHTILIGEAYIHDEWTTVRTSYIASINGKDVETRNSVYRVIDDSDLTTQPFPK